MHHVDNGESFCQIHGSAVRNSHTPHAPDDTKKKAKKTDIYMDLFMDNK